MGLLSRFSHVRLFATPGTVACQAPLSMGFPRQQYGSGMPFSSSRDSPCPGIKPTLPALAGRFFTIEPAEKRIYFVLFQRFFGYSRFSAFPQEF